MGLVGLWLAWRDLANAFAGSSDLDIGKTYTQRWDCRVTGPVHCIHGAGAAGPAGLQGAEQCLYIAGPLRCVAAPCLSLVTFLAMALPALKTSEPIARDPFTTCGNLTNTMPKKDSEAGGAPMPIQTVQRGGHGSLLILVLLLVLAVHASNGSGSPYWHRKMILIEYFCMSSLWALCGVQHSTI